MTQQELIDKRKLDILNHIYKSLYRVEILRTTRFDLYDFQKKFEFFLTSKNHTIKEYKQHTLYKWCVRMGVVRSDFITRENVIDFLKSKKNDNSIQIPVCESIDFILKQY